ncbi:hypothetical protein DCAR_0417591 [Daucus carota subsp. sativus]|uniref:MD-2-related lipid-recognition domain-containing protein n=1 Tax=Daucus carota subsp. sativus TaxID=79200 RepID=A0AAF1AZP1_DAUCS|nr:PREDICTED: putative phosphatidylglycerol/phosphatidylinositol transfer protein DDB_G0282179 [Daucus carota subsp. sativus]WOG98250.1 hypothetical protein DCAR_0417591 [Daucus carota subsp. sativus]
MALTRWTTILLLVLITLSSISSLIQATDVNYCDKAYYDVKISGVEIKPYPVKRGKSATFSIAASTDKTISEGQLLIEVAYFGWYIHSETHDLCGETSCPATGDFVISHSQVLPGVTPPGSYTLKMTMTGGDGQKLTCVTFDFSVGWFAAAEAIADI